MTDYYLIIEQELTVNKKKKNFIQLCVVRNSIKQLFVFVTFNTGRYLNYYVLNNCE